MTTLFSLNVEKSKKRTVIPVLDQLMDRLRALLPGDACAMPGPAGAPDIMICYRGQMLGLELKPRGEGFTEAQARLFPRLRDAGIRIEVARDPDQALSLVRGMGVPLKEEARHALRDVMRAQTRRRT